MGYSYGQDDGPTMCFNAAKNSQLGWYSDRENSLSPPFASITQQMRGIVDYQSQGNFVVITKIVIAGADYYVSFNRKSGFNSATQEGGNQVLVHSRAPGTGYAASVLRAKLNAGGSYVIEGTDVVKIKVNAINIAVTPAYAEVTISRGCSIDQECDDGHYCNGPETCVAGMCQSGSVPTCDDGVTCTVDSCDVPTDICVHTPVTCSCFLDSDCDDGLFCNGEETCSGGSCVSGTAPDCNDGVDCTVDSCNVLTNACDHIPDNTICGNGLFCDGTEICTAAGCQPGTAIFCNDGNICTDDSCTEGSNTYTCNFVKSSRPECLCAALQQPCSKDTDCCSNTCRGKSGRKTCK